MNMNANFFFLTCRNIIIKTYRKTSSGRLEVCRMGSWPTLHAAFRNCSCTYTVSLPTRTYGTNRCLGSISSIRIDCGMFVFGCRDMPIADNGCSCAEVPRFLQLVVFPGPQLSLYHPVHPLIVLISRISIPSPSLGLVSYLTIHSDVLS